LIGGAILGAIMGGGKGAMVGSAAGAAGGSAAIMAGGRNPATPHARRSSGADAYWKVAMELVERS